MTLRLLVASALALASAIACSPPAPQADGDTDDAAEDDDAEPSKKRPGDGGPTGKPVTATPDAAPTTPDGGTISTCQSPRTLGSIKGDVTGPDATAKGTCSEWLQVRATEDSASGDPMRVKITLVPDSTIDFDLYVYLGADASQVECSTPSDSSSVSGTSIEVATLQWGENGIPNGADDGRTISIEVRPKNPNDCTPAIWDGGGYSNWTLLVEGNTSE